MLAASATVVVVLLACKHTYTPPGAATDASATDASIDREITLTGACDPREKKFRCLANEKAAVCTTHYEKDGPRHMKEVGEWTTMACPDCDDATTSYLRCSAYAPGETCNSFITRDRCTKDGLAQFVCDGFTTTWKIESCPGGCSEPNGFVECRK